MVFQNSIANLESSPEFNKFKQEHPSAVLAHIFQLLDDANKDEIQIGCYESESGTMFTFYISKNTKEIKIGQTNELLKDPEKQINTLNLSNVKIESEEALNSANTVWKTEYPKESLLKEFFIIQNIDGEEVYNVTLFMQSFKVLNVKVSAKDGKVLSKSFESLMEMQRK